MVRRRNVKTLLELQTSDRDMSVSSRSDILLNLNIKINIFLSGGDVYIFSDSQKKWYFYIINYLNNKTSKL